MGAGPVTDPVLVDGDEFKRRLKEKLEDFPVPKSPGEIIDMVFAMPPWLTVLVVYGGLRFLGVDPLKDV